MNLYGLTWIIWSIKKTEFFFTIYLRLKLGASQAKYQDRVNPISANLWLVL